MMIEYHHYQGKADAIAQLAVATALDLETVAILTATNAKLTLKLETSQAYVQKLKEDIVHLKLKLKAAWQSQEVEKHLSKSTATVKGHLNQQIIFARSTQPKKNLNSPWHLNPI
jgi:hypothetical protein